MTDQGASPRELVLESCRRDNTSLLEEVLADLSKLAPNGKGTEYIAKTLNEVRDGVGNGALHLAASHGSYDVLDLLLDQEGLEIDEFDRMQGDTPLHKAVRYVNSLSQKEWSSGQPIVEILLDAGCDPRIQNKAKLRPSQLVDPRNETLSNILKKAEFAIQAGDDVVVEDDDGPTGSGSDSD